MLRGLVMAIAAAFAVGTLSAQSHEQLVIASDTVTYTYTPIDQTSRAQTGIERFGLSLNDYLTFDGADARDVKFSVIGAPAYSEATGWRLAGVATLHYRTKQSASPHQLRLNASASLKGCYNAALEGVNYFGDRHALRYGGGFALDRYYLYGLDFATSLGASYGEYASRNYDAYLRYDYRLCTGLTLGVRAEYENRSVVDADNIAVSIIADGATHFSGLGLGLGLKYSTLRTEDVNLSRGVVFAVEYEFSPAVLNSVGGALHEVSALFDWYQPLWRGGLLAFDLYGECHSANTPWMYRAMLGGESRMRGYYYGRFSGNTLITVQLELRQRVWEGIVVAGWGGCGTAFLCNEPASWDLVLPTYGAGVRWYFNPTSLVRIDCGFGRGCHAFIVGYTEAF